MARYVVTLYDELEVSPTASTEVIQGAYRSLAKRYHPDKNPDDEDAAARMRRINEAYNVLNDPERRAAYDQELAEQARRAEEEERLRLEQVTLGREQQRRSEEEYRDRQRYEAQLARSEAVRPPAVLAAPAPPPPEPLRRRASFSVGVALLVGGVAVVALLVGLAIFERVSPERASSSATTGTTTTVTSAPAAPTTGRPRSAMPKLTVEDEITLATACDPFMRRGDPQGYESCKGKQLEIARATPQPALDELPIDVAVAIKLACRSHQAEGDLAAYWACLNKGAEDKAAGSNSAETNGAEDNGAEDDGAEDAR